jgi:MYXO-CTERM domain-containing protein
MAALRARGARALPRSGGDLPWWVWANALLLAVFQAACDEASLHAVEEGTPIGAGAVVDNGGEARAVSPVHDEGPTELARRTDAGSGPRVHYLNFSDGTTVLRKGKVDDAANNVSAICGTAPLAFPKWEGTEAEKRELVQKLQRAWAPYNIVITLTRPTSGDYSMEMIGPPGNGCDFDATIAGVAMLDCQDAQKRNVSFTFAGGYVTAAQEAAHALGLEHTNVACDVMGAGYSTEACDGDRWGYPDEESPILEPRCGRRTQNSHRRMLAVVGPWPTGIPKPDAWTGACPDDREPPQVRIVEPGAGRGASSPFSVKLDVSDECAGPARARLAVATRGLVNDAPGPGPYAWDLDLDPGEVELHAEVWDANGNRGEARLTVTVGEASELEPQRLVQDGRRGDEPLAMEAGSGCAVGGGRGGGPGALPLAAFTLAALVRRRRIR